MRRVSRTTLILILGLFLLSVLVRAPMLDRPKVTYDEHVYFGDGMERVGNFDPDAEVWSDQLPRYVDNPPLAFYYFGAWSLIGETFGASSFSDLLYWARLGSVFLGSMLVILSFLVARRLFGFRTGVATGLLMAVLPLAVGWSRITYIEIVVITAFTFSVYGFLETREWPNKWRIPVLALLCGVPFAAKYPGIFAVPLLAFLWVLYADEPLISDYVNLERISRRIPGVTESRLEEMFDFALLNVIFFLGAYVFLVIVFPYLWTNPIGNFIHIFAKESSRGGFGVMQILSAFGSNTVTILLRTPVPVSILAAAGTYFAVRSRDGLATIAWLAAPMLIALFGFHTKKYMLPLIVPLTILAAYGLETVSERAREMTGYGFYPALTVLFLFVLGSTAVAYPYPADGYYSGATGFAPGAFELAEERDLIAGPGWLGSGVAEGMSYIYSNAPPGATVQIYADPQPFYIGIDRTLNYTDPTETPRAEYVLINSLYVLKDRRRPAFWFEITDRPNYVEKHGLDLSMDYTDLEQDSRYRRAWEASTMGAPVARVYRRVPQSR